MTSLGEGEGMYGGSVRWCDPSVSGPYVTLPHVCQGSSHSDGFCQALITDQSKEGAGGAAVTLESGAGGGATARLCVNRLID